jgi:hypothetical protein
MHFIRGLTGIALAVLIAAAQEAPKGSLIDGNRLLADLQVLSGDAMQGRRTARPALRRRALLSRIASRLREPHPLAHCMNTRSRLPEGAMAARTVA